MRFSTVFLTFITSPFFSYLPTSSQELPIKPTRTVSFTTDEGTYMNIDLSPDGKTLLFDLLGDLYTLPAQGGKATQITRGMALSLAPKWSPDGKKIAYMSDYSGSFHLNIIKLNSNFHKVVRPFDPGLYHYSRYTWSPDGSYIACNKNIYALHGGKILSNPVLKNLLSFSPNGRFAYFIDSQSIYSYNLTTGIKKLLTPVLRNYYDVVLSPDAQMLCYIADSNDKKVLLLKNLSTQGSRILVPSLFLQNPRYTQNPIKMDFCFSPDSKYIFISYGGKIHRIEVVTGVDNIIPFRANIQSNLGPYDYNTFPVSQDSIKIRYIRSTSLSPDGKNLIFSALNKLYSMKLSTRKSHVLVDQSINQFYPTYSPDGQWIAYVSWCDTLGGYLWRVQTNGGTPQQLTRIRGIYEAPTWSPDGTHIAVIRGKVTSGSEQNSELGDLELVSLNDSSARTIADSIPLRSLIDFSADGHRLIYSPKQNPADRNVLKPQLISLDLIDNVSTVLAVGSNLMYYQQKRVSPDGRYIVLSMAEDLYLIPMCNIVQPMVISDSNNQPLGIRFTHGVDPIWEKRGKVLAWTYGNHFYRINPDSIFANTANSYHTQKSIQLDDFTSIDIKPEEAIELNIKKESINNHGIIALKGIRIITMHGDQVIENGIILIKNGRLVAIGPLEKVPIPKAARVINLPGSTVIPGFIDLHLHMSTPSLLIPQQSWPYLANLAYGVTTARDPASNIESFRLAELFKTGQMIGPRLITVGRPVRFGDGIVQINNLEDAKSVAHKRQEYGATYIKDYLPPPRIQRQWLLIASRQAGLNMTNEGFQDPILELAMMKDGSTGVEHNANWGDVYKDVISFITDSRSFFTPTLQVSGFERGKEYFKYKYWHVPNQKLQRFSFSKPEMHPTDNGAESIEVIENSQPKDSINPDFLAPAAIDARIYHAGGRICLGSHGNDEGIGVHNELWALQMGGLTNMEALRCATINGAEALGMQKDLGSIEVGKIADLIVLNKNPLDDIHNSREILYVMRDGILYDGNTLDEIWPEQKKCPEWRMPEAIAKASAAGE